MKINPKFIGPTSNSHNFCLVIRMIIIIPFRKVPNESDPTVNHSKGCFKAKKVVSALLWYFSASGQRNYHRICRTLNKELFLLLFFPPFFCMTFYLFFFTQFFFSIFLRFFIFLNEHENKQKRGQKL